MQLTSWMSYLRTSFMKVGMFVSKVLRVHWSHTWAVRHAHRHGAKTMERQGMGPF
ncbi:hypothetical protein DPMN_065176 [Dreissena polymorpha]|uniref:Uncharacterized protein n=1 Tax=Dreissena polymorpha TaxID=45954 RepID=A0A9D4CEV7_DREPO|nr:hypothetical protein DPMN_065176 [Dreissena polymorpha]